MSDLAQQILNNYQTNNIKIIKIFYGLEAIDRATDVFNVSRYMLDQWPIYQKQQAMFLIYVKKLPMQRYVGFKFVMGDFNFNSILGQEYDYETGKNIIKKLASK